MEDRVAWPAAVHGIVRVRHDLGTEQQQQKHTLSNLETSENVHISEGWEGQIQGTKRSQVLPRALFRVADDLFQLCPHRVRGAGNSGALFIKASIPFMKVYIHDLSIFQRFHLLLLGISA